MALGARLERVLGCTACSRSLVVDPQSGVVAYPAGSALVLVNPRSQCRLSLLTQSKCHLTCLAWSPCGQFIASGEFGTDPKVRIWALRKYSNGGSDENKAEPKCELGWHKLGISCLAFSADSSLLISVGNNHDKQILVWDWRAGRRLAESRLTCQVNAMAQAETGRMFVTVGVRHVKFWYVEKQQHDENGGGGVLLQGRSAILAEHRNNTFIDCCCAPGQRTFALTQSRLLVEFVDKRLVNLYQMGGEVPFALATGPGLLFMGFGDGAIRALDSTRMEPLADFGQPHLLHSDIASTSTTIMKREEEEENGEKKFPDVHAMTFYGPSGILTALYSDRSMYHWLLNPSNYSSSSASSPPPTSSSIQPIRLSSQLFHVGPIFDLEICSVGDSSAFFTAGADETVRFWSLQGRRSAAGAEECHGQLPNALSPEMCKILFLSPELDSLTERPDKNFGGIISDTLESTTGTRCVRLSPEGKHLACGRKNGNICVFDLRNKEWPRLVDFEAHDGEVLCLEYGGGGGDGEDPTDLGDLLLASGSRDRLIHLFDAARQYSHLMTLDEHRAPVIGLKFMPAAKNSPNNSSSSLLLVSFGTDQLILCRHLDRSSEDGVHSISSIHQIGAISPPVAITAFNQSNGTNWLLIACQDCALRQFDADTGKLLKTFVANEGNKQQEDGTRIMKLCLDPSGTFAAILCSDRTVRLLDLENEGNCVAVLGLPSDCITGLAFSADCRRLLLVSYSGCISIWRLCAQVNNRCVAKMATQTMLLDDDDGNVENNSNAHSSPLDCRPISPESAIEDSLFGSLASLDIVIGIQSPLANTGIGHQKEEEKGIIIGGGDDELDSGIGGGGSSRTTRQQKRQQKQRFELKRLLPSESGGGGQDHHNNNQTTAESGIGELSHQQALEEEDVVPSMLSPSPSSIAVASSRPRQHAPPPPYHHQQHFQQGANPPNIHPFQNPQSHLMPPPNNKILAQQQQPQNGSGGSRSMSNLHAGGVRRRWNIGTASSPTPSSSSATMAQHHQNAAMMMENNPIMIMPNNNAEGSTTYFASTFANANNQPQFNSQRFNTHQNQPVFLHQSPFSPPPPHSNNFGGIPTQQNANGQRFGISTSVSLSAIRGKLATESADAALPTNNQCWSSSPNRNSLTHRFLQNGQNNNNIDHQNCIWNPSTLNATPNKNATNNLMRRRASNLFNSGASSMTTPTTSIGPFGSASSPCSSNSQGSTPSVPSGIATGELRPCPRRLFNPESNSNGEKGGSTGGGARLALTRIRQRRAGAGDQTTPFGGGKNDEHFNNNNHHKTTPLLLRSRSQSPSQLALAMLAQQQSAHSSALSPSSNLLHQRSRTKALSPSAQSAISSTSSGQRPSASRLQEARQRLKKSQENLLAALRDDNENGEASTTFFGAEEDGSEFEGTMDGGGGGFGRSRSIGNLGLISSRGIADPLDGAASLSSKNRRLMAKSVTDLAADHQKQQHEGDESGQNRLAKCRQRLAQSIRDIRRISESDLMEPTTTKLPNAFTTMQSNGMASALVDSPSSSIAIGGIGGASLMRGGPRRGVQKKLDRQWLGRGGQPDLLIGDVAIESNGGIARRQSSSSTTASPFFHAFNPAAALMRKDSPIGAIRSETTLVPSSSNAIGTNRSPRSNYFAQKLAAAGPGPLNSSVAHKTESATNKPGCRSLSAELGMASAILTNNATFTSASSKRMAMHAQECIREMQQACNKLLGTRQLIRMETSISQEEKRQMLASVNQAVAAFARRLGVDEENDDEDGNNNLE